MPTLPAGSNQKPDPGVGVFARDVRRRWSRRYQWIVFDDPPCQLSLAQGGTYAPGTKTLKAAALELMDTLARDAEALGDSGRTLRLVAVEAVVPNENPFLSVGWILDCARPSAPGPRVTYWVASTRAGAAWTFHMRCIPSWSSALKAVVPMCLWGASLKKVRWAIQRYG